METPSSYRAPHRSPGRPSAVGAGSAGPQLTGLFSWIGRDCHAVDGLPPGARRRTLRGSDSGEGLRRVSVFGWFRGVPSNVVVRRPVKVYS